MYFNEKEDTNIDKEFKNTNKFDFEKNKGTIIITGIIILLLIIIAIVIIYLKNKKVYYIELNGGSEINVYEGIEFIDPGYIAYDNRGNDLSSSVTTNGKVDEEVIGTYQIVYTLYNKSVKRLVNVIASQSKFNKIYLEGEITMTLKVGEEYVEPGYYYNDIKVGDMHDKISVNGTVDTSKPGTYRLTYTVVNSEEMTVTAERIVIVEE